MVYVSSEDTVNPSQNTGTANAFWDRYPQHTALFQCKSTTMDVFHQNKQHCVDVQKWFSYSSDG